MLRTMLCNVVLEDFKLEHMCPRFSNCCVFSWSKKINECFGKWFIKKKQTHLFAFQCSPLRKMKLKLVIAVFDIYVIDHFLLKKFEHLWSRCTKISILNLHLATCSDDTQWEWCLHLEKLQVCCFLIFWCHIVKHKGQQPLAETFGNLEI